MAATSVRASLIALAALLAACQGSSGPDPIRALQIGTAAVSLPKGLSQRLTATATLASGGSAPADATWSSDEPAVASVDAEGVVTGRTQGATVIRASVGALSAQVPVTVLPPVPVSIRIEPVGASLPLGLSQAFRAVGLRLSDGSEGALTEPVTWSTTDGGVVTIAADGTARPVSPGVADVVATAGALSGHATVLAQPAAPLSLDLGPTTLALGRVERRPLAVGVRHTDGTSPAPRGPVTVTSDDPTVVFEQAGALVARRPGATTLHVAADGFTATIQVSVAAHAVVFRTSTIGPGNLGAWPEARWPSGILAGDSICQARAAAGGLTGTYVAFLSDSSSDAACRVLGFTGRFAQGCSLASPPDRTGAWIRRDGFQLGDDLVALVEQGPRVPILLDESGAERPGALWTGGGSIANPFPDNCADWTSSDAALPGRTGHAEYGGSTWSLEGWGSCTSGFGLLCFEVLDRPADPLPALTPVVGRRAFATAESGIGDLSAWPDAGGLTGLAAGDAICRAHAARAGLPRSEAYKAWLSDATTDARSRFTGSTPWYRVDGVPLAATIADLTDGTLFTSLSLAASGEMAKLYAWTGTGQDGRRTASTCGDWTSNLGEGTYGKLASVQLWSDIYPAPCHNAMALLCLED